MTDHAQFFVPEGSRNVCQQLDPNAVPFLVCACEDIDGAAAEIAHALNHLPKVEAMLLKVAQTINNPEDGQVLAALSAEIQALMCGDD